MITAAESVIAKLKEAGLGDVVYVPGQESYNDRLNSYWSCTPRLKSWAIVQPRATAEVAAAVKALVNETDCKFAIRRSVSDTSHQLWNWYLSARMIVAVTCLGLDAIISKTV
jgi:hypothetical protein